MSNVLGGSASLLIELVSDVGFLCSHYTLTLERGFNVNKMLLLGWRAGIRRKVPSERGECLLVRIAIMDTNDLRNTFSEGGVYLVHVNNGNIVSLSLPIHLPENRKKTVSFLVSLTNGVVVDAFALREGEFVTSLQALKDVSIKAGHSAFIDE